jgi:hypothetical protein
MKLQGLFLFFIFFISCNHKEPKRETVISSEKEPSIAYSKIDCKAGEIITSLTAQSNPAISFALYCPKADQDKPLPVIYFFDPHADGSLPLNRYQSIADELNVLLVGCNSTKNGMSMADAETAAMSMITDCMNRLSLNQRAQIISGFSGGSKVACTIAARHSFFSGLIACSGATFEKNAFSDSLNVVSVAGQKDFNYHEMIAFNDAIANNKHIFIETENTHEWPTEKTMKRAIQFQLLQAVIQKRIVKNDLLLQQWKEEWNKEIIALVNKNEPYLLHRYLQNAIEAFNGIANVTAWHDQLMAVEKSEAYQKYITKQRNLIYQEKEMQKMLNDAFANQNELWWQKEINDLKTGSVRSDDKLIASLNSRLLGYIGIACYSYSKQLVSENQKEAAKVLAIYKMAEPDNAEAWFLSAVFFANQNNNEQAIHDFQQARLKGFNDLSRLNEFPALQKLVAP